METGGTESAAVPPPSVKPAGFDLWRRRLGGARLVVAPMVDQSEAAWRMLSRKYGAELCYTPMYHASVFVKDAKYRKECLTTYPEDRPLIVQFCCNSPATLLAAARQCQGRFDALDINLGCPQSIARRGHYGAFLQDEWELIRQLVDVVHTQTNIPVTCKIRVFDDRDKTIRYAQMLESAGCQLLTVHGRTREMKGPLTGLADWDAIKAARESVSIPVFANGNIQYLADIHHCLEYTGVQGVMTAEGNLHNPALFADAHPAVWQVADEYLQLARRYPCPLSYSRGHLFKMLYHCLLMPANHDARDLAARATRLEQLEEAVALLRQRYQRYTEDGGPQWTPGPADEAVSRLPMAPFLCQPHEREPIEAHLKKMEANHEKQRRERDERRQAAAHPEMKRPRHQDATVVSKRKQKKMARGVKFGVNRVAMERCQLCCNPRGLRCQYLLCRLHCRQKCFDDGLDCTGHRILCKTKRQRARDFWNGVKDQQSAAAGEDITAGGGVKSQEPGAPDDEAYPSAAFDVAAEVKSKVTAKMEGGDDDDGTPDQLSEDIELSVAGGQTEDETTEAAVS